jgi:hypothetical protein
MRCDGLVRHVCMTALCPALVQAAARSGNTCEPWYYAGEKRLIADDKEMTADYFGKSIATTETNFEEYRAAQAELKIQGNSSLP